MIQDLIARLRKEDRGNSFVKIYDGTACDEEAIRQWERRTGWRSPNDYRQYLCSVGRCKLHGTRAKDHCFSVKMFSLSEVVLFARAAFGKDECYEIPTSWYAIGDAQDGNFIVMDMASVRGFHARIIDGCCEYITDLAVISLSFEEFLECSIADPETSSGGGDVETGARYWSQPGHYYGQTGDST